MGGECGTYKLRRRACRVLVGNSEVHPGIDVRIMLKLIIKKHDWRTDEIELAQDRDWEWALLNTVMNFLFLLNVENFVIM